MDLNADNVPLEPEVTSLTSQNILLLEKIRKAWILCPHLRLGQLLGNILYPWIDPFYLSNSAFEAKIDTFTKDILKIDGSDELIVR